jgi:hypothetical protein
MLGKMNPDYLVMMINPTQHLNRALFSRSVPVCVGNTSARLLYLKDQMLQAYRRPYVVVALGTGIT